MKYATSAAYISGAICGSLWMPCAMAGKPIQRDARGAFGFYAKGDTFREAFASLLMREGGDFQNAQFTADTVLRIERRTKNARGMYSVHVREIELAKLCPDLVNVEAYSGDFFQE